MAIYHRIRDLREDHDKTQQELADYLGTSTQYYGKYELGRAEIPFERAIALAKYYNVSLDYIAGISNVKNGTTRGFSEEETLSYLIKKFSPTEKRKLSSFLKALLSALNSAE